ncbi:PglY protein [Amycolatopsis sp. NPDC102389]|uniref:PglY protein n=1 Tax=Amycolatopsis sp. NPDC102389 TaxID=3363941 RepID=UPI0038087BC5
MAARTRTARPGGQEGGAVSDKYLREVLDLPKSVHAGDFKVELTGGFTEVEARVAEYVVTDQLRTAFRDALGVVRSAVRDAKSHAAYLHGSFGSGKSHFLTVLHAILNNHQAARAKPGLQPVIAEHDEWLRGKKFLMVPYHLVGSSDIDSAILGGYVKRVRELHPDHPTPPVYKADAMLADARGQREFLKDDAKFAEWLGGDAPATTERDDDDDLDVIEGARVSRWTSTELDRAFAAPAGDPVRDALISALLSGPMSSYIRGASGDAAAFIPLENGLTVISRHARDLGYDGLILFLDELILWLQGNMADQQFVNTQVSKLVKLIESGDADRVLPIVSFISRQRDLSKLVGEDVTGSEVKNLEAQLHYLAERFDTVSLEDRNLPAIIKERVLKPLPGGRVVLDEAFAGIESTKAADRDVLLDAGGATGATWQDFRAVYPLSPALLNVLVALSGALQRERTGLKLLQEMLHRRREDMKVGELIPLGDLWDVLADGTGEAFTDRLRKDAEAGHRFYVKARAYLQQRYGEGSTQFVAMDRFVKTLLLAALAPNVPALARLTGGRLAALNHGSIRSRTVSAGAMAVSRLRDMQAEFGELRSEGDEDPVFRLQLSDLDIEPLLDDVGEQDTLGARRIWTKRQLWSQLGVRDTEDFVCEREIVWKGTRRTAEFVFANVRDSRDLPDMQFVPTVPGRVRIILDYPFDEADQTPLSDAARVSRLRRDGVNAPTLVWLPHFFSPQKSSQLGRLLKIQYLLERDRLADYAGTMSEENRVKVRHQLQAQRDNLESQLAAALRQLYGIAQAEEATVGKEVGEDGHVLSLQDGHKPRLAGGAGFEYNALTLADGLFDALYPKHPNFDPSGNRKATTLGDLRTVLNWIIRAMEDGQRRVVVDRAQLALVKRIVHPLELGEVSDGPLNVSTEWRRRIEQAARQHGASGDLRVEEIRSWIEELGYTGWDKSVGNLVIATYALLADRAWVLHGSPLREPPDLDKIGVGHALRAQELPSADEFATARRRAATLFGLHVPETLFTRNVNRLADEVREKAAALEGAGAGVRRALERHMAALGIDGRPDAPRVTSGRDAADLLARLTAMRDSTGLVQELASAGYDTSDEVLAAAISSAPEVLAALERVEWTLLDSVRKFTGRGDPVGNQAEGLVDDLAAAAAADQFTRDLVPVLEGLGRRAVGLVNEAARLAAVPAPVYREQAAEPPVAAEGADSETAVRRERAGGRTRIHASAVEQELVRLVAEMDGKIRAYAKDHPGVEFDLIWSVVGDDGLGEDTTG